ncbi:MAG: hypothetical protein ABEL76_03680, partial [Bradymonadaceae bacterium]
AMQAYAVRWNHWRKPETELSHWQPAATAERGVVHREPGRTAPGWRLYATAIRTRARLIGPEGTVAHRWELPFSEAWPHPEHVSQPVADRFIRWGAVHVFDDGSLLVNYETMFDFPFSYGMVKMNRQSEPIWRFEGRSHHNFEVTADGRIWTLTQNVRQVGDGRLPGSTQPVVVADGLVELSSARGWPSGGPIPGDGTTSTPTTSRNWVRPLPHITTGRGPAT